MHLQLKSCAIRSWTLSDADAVQRYANNRNIWRNLRDIFPHPYRLNDAIAFLNCVVAEKPETTFAIAIPWEAIGCIGLRLGTDVHRKTAELGYWLGEPFWSKGIMSEAVAAFVQYAFGAYDLIRIYAEPFSANRASARVLEKAGFACEACLRANVIKDGRIEDSLLYARLREPLPG
jgi:ribosomal-protein-alanine N-acetyltransferase